jgi:hypothetical protein
MTIRQLAVFLETFSKTDPDAPVHILKFDQDEFIDLPYEVDAMAFETSMLMPPRDATTAIAGDSHLTLRIGRVADEWK